jgi:hypothetical protein
MTVKHMALVVILFAVSCTQAFDTSRLHGRLKSQETVKLQFGSREEVEHDCRLASYELSLCLMTAMHHHMDLAVGRRFFGGSKDACVEQATTAKAVRSNVQYTSSKSTDRSVLEACTLCARQLDMLLARDGALREQNHARREDPAVQIEEEVGQITPENIEAALGELGPLDDPALMEMQMDDIINDATLIPL